MHHLVRLAAAALLLGGATAGMAQGPQAGAAPLLRHLGIYGYQAEALQHLAALAPTPLERSESLEQLRALENGIAIRVLTGARVSLGVDTADDVEQVERILRQRAQ